MVKYYSGKLAYKFSNAISIASNEKKQNYRAAYPQLYLRYGIRMHKNKIATNSISKSIVT
jgi:hypothetical protein